MRLKKRVKVFPGFHLNLSKSGISSTIGKKGASITFSKKGTYLNTSIPGTEISFRQKIGGNASRLTKKELKSEETLEIKKDVLPDIITSPETLNGEIKSADVNEMQSASLIELKKSLHEAYTDRIEIQNEILKESKKLENDKAIRILACIVLVGFFIKSLKKKIEERKEYIQDLESQFRNSIIDIDIYFDSTFQDSYANLTSSYKSLLTSNIIWDITSAVEQDMKATRSAASKVVTRVPVKFKFDNIPIIKSSYSAFHFENKNGGDLFIYPAFVIITNNKNEFGLIDIKEFELHFGASHFLEERTIPTDTKIVDKTWAKVNKNGQPDKRFKDNYQIPIVQYGQFDLKSISGLNESYSISNYEFAAAFSRSFNAYKALL